MKFPFYLLILFSLSDSPNVTNSHIEFRNQKKIALLISVEDTVVPNYDKASTQNGDRYRDNIEDLLLDSDFKRGNIKKLTNPTGKEFLVAFESAVKSLNDDDFMVFYFYGHGGQVYDESGDETEDHRDETLVMQNKEILDDQIYEILMKYDISARILFLIEACNTGTSIKVKDEKILIHNEVIDKVRKPVFNIIYVGATTDGYSVPSDLFNRIFIETYKDEEYESYISFFKDLMTSMNDRGVMISVDFSMSSEKFIRQRPFQ